MTLFYITSLALSIHAQYELSVSRCFAHEQCPPIYFQFRCERRVVLPVITVSGSLLPSGVVGLLSLSMAALGPEGSHSGALVTQDLTSSVVAVPTSENTEEKKPKKKVLSEETYIEVRTWDNTHSGMSLLNSGGDRLITFTPH